MRPQRLGSSIYDILYQRLMSLEIKPGDRISVDSLVREMGVSQTPIREALSQLEAQGLVIKIHLIGYSAAPTLSAKEFHDLYELRLLIEPAIAAKAAHVIDKLMAEELELSHRKIAEVAKTPDRSAFNRVSSLDANLHSLIAQASDNQFFHDAVVRQRFHAHLFRLGHHSRWLVGMVAEHEQIVRSITRGDSEAAAASMKFHIEQSFKRYIDAVQ